MINEQQIADFAAACTAMRLEYYKERYPSILAHSPNDADVVYKIGKKYARCFVSNGGQPFGSVWCFIDLETGDIYKPASYAVPAKHSRGNIANGVADVGVNGPAYLR